MKKLDNTMQDFIFKETGDEAFCLLLVDLEKDDFGPYKNYIIFYKKFSGLGGTHLSGTYISDTAINKNIKWLKTDKLRIEALKWCVSIPFEKGLELGNNNHDIGTLIELLPGGRFGGLI